MTDDNHQPPPISGLRKMPAPAKPDTRQPLTVGQTVFAWVVVIAILAAVAPLILWFVGNVIVPAYQWGTAWIG